MSSALVVTEARARKALLLSLVGGIPLFVLHGTTWGAVNTPKLSLLLGGVGLSLILRAIGISAGSTRPWIRPLSFPLVTIVGPLAIAWAVASPFKMWSLWGAHERYLGLIPYVACAAFGLILLDAFRGNGGPILAALTFSAAVVGTYGVIQRLGLDPIIWEPSPLGSTLGNPNYSGTFLGMNLPILAWHLATGDGRHRDLALLAAIPIIGGWLLANSQGGWGAGLVGLLVTAALMPGPRWRHSVAAIGAGGVFAAMALAAPVALTPWGASLLGPTVVDRGQAAQAALRMAWDHPLLGRGPNAFALEGVRYRSPEEALSADTAMNDPHSAFLVFLSSAGALGGIGFVGLAGWVGTNTIRKFPSALAPPAAGGIAAYFTGTLVANDELTLRVTLWALLAVAAMGAPDRLTPRSSSSKGLRRIVAAGLAGVIGLAGLIAGARILTADRRALQGFRAAQNDDVAAARLAFRHSRKTDPTYEYRKLSATKIGELGTRRGKAGQPYYEEMKEIFSYLEGLPDLDAILSHARLTFAWAVKVNRDELKESLDLYGRARGIDPLHPLIAAETANVLTEMGRGSDAAALLEPFARRNPPFPSFWVSAARAAIDTGEWSAACSALRRAAAMEPENQEGKVSIHELRALGKSVSEARDPTFCELDLLHEVR